MGWDIKVSVVCNGDCGWAFCLHIVEYWVWVACMSDLGVSSTTQSSGRMGCWHNNMSTVSIHDSLTT